MDLLQEGVDRSVIALWLGHESVDTTQIYLEATLAMKEKALSKTKPLNGKFKRHRPGDKLLGFLNDPVGSRKLRRVIGEPRSPLSSHLGLNATGPQSLGNSPGLGIVPHPMR